MANDVTKALIIRLGAPRVCDKETRSFVGDGRMGVGKNTCDFLTLVRLHFPRFSSTTIGTRNDGAHERAERNDGKLGGKKTFSPPE